MTRRSTVLSGGVALALSVASALAGMAMLLPATASAASSHAVPAAAPARIASELRTEIGVVLKHNRSGVVINARQVSYDHGHFIVTVPVPGALPDAAGGCSKGWFCIWSGAEFTLYKGQVQYPLDTNIDVTQFLPTQRIGSLSNARKTGSILSAKNNHNACYSAGSSTESVGAPFNTYPYIYLQKNDNC